jgi:hypothetical protein
MDDQTPEEVEAAFAPDGPIAAAHLFLDAALGADLAAVWSLSTYRLRRELTAAWVDANQRHPLLAASDLEALPEALARLASADPMWPVFQKTQIGEFEENLGHLAGPTWGWTSRPRPLSNDRELALLVDTGVEDATTLEANTPLPGFGFVVELVERRWLVDDFLGGPALTALAGS